MGFGLPGGPVGGILVVALMTLALCAVLGAVLHQHELAVLLGRLGRRVRPPAETPASMPIERIARDVRRLHVEVRTIRPGTPMARRLGIVRAYDDVLVDACRSLGVPDTLSGLPPGVEREAERLHVESELEARGLRLAA